MTRESEPTYRRSLPSLLSLALLPALFGASALAAAALPFTAEDTFHEQIRGYGFATLYDFDGDGALDLVYNGLDSANNYMFATWRNPGSGDWARASVTRSSSTYLHYGLPSIGDVDGNGRPDLLFYYPDPTYAGESNFLLQDFPAAGAAGLNSASILPLDSIPKSRITRYGDFWNSEDKVTLRPPGDDPLSHYLVGNFPPDVFDSIRKDNGSTVPVLVGDFNADGIEDGIGIPGYNTTLDDIVYRASSPSGYKDQKISAPRIYGGIGSAGDYDNDGDLDFIICGMVQGVNRWYLFENTGDGFIQHEGPGVSPGHGFALFGDVDHDGDLDLVSGGSDAPFLLYRNTTVAKNLPPTVPAGANASLQKDTVRLSWSPSQDDLTPSKGLTYNVRIGTRPGGDDIQFAGANPVTGTLLFPHFGNVAGSTHSDWFRIFLTPGTYFWAVQAIDNGYAASAFTPEQSFEVKPDHSVSIHGDRGPARKATARSRVGFGRNAGTVSVDGRRERTSMAPARKSGP
jgi:hypothetical protein